MKALTLTQPWATLVAVGVKRVETRAWSTSYRGPLLIHAAKGGADLAFEQELKDRWILPIAQLPRGAIVARCRLVDVRQTADSILLASLTDIEAELGDYGRGRFAWLLADVEPIDPPVPWRGALGLWEAPEL